MPTSCWMRLSCSCSCLRSLRSSAPSGSSSSSTSGFRTSARASATRCCWPPESCARLRRAAPGRGRRARASRRPASRISALRDLALLQPERDVVEDRQVREQRVLLEDRVHRALVRPQRRDVAAVHLDDALGRLDEPGDHPQRRRLAAAARADDREELAVGDLDVDAVDRARRRRRPCAGPAARSRVAHSAPLRPRPSTPPAPVGRSRVMRPATRKVSRRDEHEPGADGVDLRRHAQADLARGRAPGASGRRSLPGTAT